MNDAFPGQENYYKDEDFDIIRYVSVTPVYHQLLTRMEHLAGLVWTEPRLASRYMRFRNRRCARYYC